MAVEIYRESGTEPVSILAEPRLTLYTYCCGYR